MYKPTKVRVHFVGIGGIGMSGIAEVLLARGYMVSGSDMQESEITKRLETLGAIIHYQHAAENVQDRDVVVVSSAVRDTNPEVVEAKKLKTPIIPRAEMLGELMKMHTSIAIAGTHGKTTTTSMISMVVNHSGLDPTIIIGGRLNSLGSNAKSGSGEFLIAEADESDRSFLQLPATIAVVTNIDNDHLNTYGNIEKIKDAFVDFVNKIPFYGLAILCVDDPNVRSILPSLNKPFLTYGLSPQADLQAKNLIKNKFSTKFEVVLFGKSLGEVICNLPGEHNVLNALAGVAVCREIDIEFTKIQSGFQNFCGVKRRFERKGEKNNITFVDDYGHHPSEIKVTLDGVRKTWPGRVVTIFQPHRYSRTKDCYNDFLAAFDNTDLLFIVSIYAANEDPIPGITSEQLAKDIRSHGHQAVEFVGDANQAVKLVLPQLQAGDLLLTLGAGNVYRIGEEILANLK